MTALAACGGGDKKKDVKKPTPTETEVEAPPKPETEADREALRLAIAQSIVPEGSSCLPTSLREAGAPRLDIAAVGADVMVCATDVDTDRLLGPIACWKVNVPDGTLAYVSGTPLPGHAVSVKLDGTCARGYCLPADASPTASVAHMSWSPDSAKVAVLAAESVHIFDVASKAHEKSFSVRGEKGVTTEPSSVHWVGSTILVEGTDQGQNGNVWVFKADGTAVGVIEQMGGKEPKPASTFGGSFVVLDQDTVGISEQGFSTLWTYDVETGKRAKIIRKVAKSPCKPAETLSYWEGKTEGLAPKCSDYLAKTFAPYQGADLLEGARSFVVALRGARLGELAVLDKKSLAEKQAIKLTWCGDEATGAPAADATN